MNTLRKILTRASKMCSLSYYILKFSVLFSCLLLTGSLILYIFSGGLSVITYSTYYTAEEMLRMPFVVLLIGVIASACIEDISAQ